MNMLAGQPPGGGSQACNDGTPRAGPYRGVAESSAGRYPSAMAAQTIDWKWVAIGVVILLAVQLALSIAFGVFGLMTLGFGFLLFVILKPITWFLGGLVTGYVSPGITIREPAIAAIIISVVGILFDASRSAGGRVLGVIISSVIALVLAIAGAQIGERMQRGRA